MSSRRAVIATAALGMMALSHSIHAAEILQLLPPIDPVIDAAIKCTREHTSYFSRQGKPLEVALQAAADLCFTLGSPVDDLIVTSTGERSSPEARRTFLEGIWPSLMRSTRRDFQNCIRIPERAPGQTYPLCKELLGGREGKL
jgi:hypothetical protein